MASPKYTLNYFDARGGGEPVRFLFEYLGIPYEDKRFTHGGDDWAAAKSSYPWKVLPVLDDHEKGFRLSQSSAIISYLGRKHKLDGANEQESARCLEYVMSIVDLFMAAYPMFRETDEDKKNEIKRKFEEETVPKFFPKFEADIKANGGKWLVGSGITYADFVVSSGLYQLKVFLENPALLDKYPGLISYCDNIFDIPQIKAWIARRPVTKY